MKPGMFEDWRECAKEYAWRICFIALCVVMVYSGFVLGGRLWP